MTFDNDWDSTVLEGSANIGNLGLLRVHDCFYFNLSKLPGSSDLYRRIGMAR